MSMVQVEHPKALILEPRASGGWNGGACVCSLGPGAAGRAAAWPTEAGRGVTQMSHGSPAQPCTPFDHAGTWVVVDGEEVPHELTLAEIHPSLCSVYIPPSGARQRTTEDLV